MTTPALAEDPSEPGAAAAADRFLDLAYLFEQTGGDKALVRELLGLFVAQARHRLPELARMAPRARAETAHLLKGSCLGIGAWAAADAAQAVEDAPGAAAPLACLADALAATEAAIQLASVSPPT